MSKDSNSLTELAIDKNSEVSNSETVTYITKVNYTGSEVIFTTLNDRKYKVNTSKGISNGFISTLNDMLEIWEFTDDAEEQFKNIKRKIYDKKPVTKEDICIYDKYITINSEYNKEKLDLKSLSNADYYDIVERFNVDFTTDAAIYLQDIIDEIEYGMWKVHVVDLESAPVLAVVVNDDIISVVDEFTDEYNNFDVPYIEDQTDYYIKDNDTNIHKIQYDDMYVKSLNSNTIYKQPETERNVKNKWFKILEDNSKSIIKSFLSITNIGLFLILLTYFAFVNTNVIWMCASYYILLPIIVYLIGYTPYNQVKPYKKPSDINHNGKIIEELIFEYANAYINIISVETYIYMDSAFDKLSDLLVEAVKIITYPILEYEENYDDTVFYKIE